MRFKSFKVKGRLVLYFLLIAPFFPVQSLSQLGTISSIWNIIYDIIAIFRISVAMISIKYFFLNNIKSNTLTRWTIAIELMTLFACAINGSLTIRFSLTHGMSIVGFVMLCQILDKKNAKTFLNANLFFWGLTSCLGVVSTFLFPLGFNHASITNYAIYFFGSKNSAYFYYSEYIFLRAYKDLNEQKSISNKTIIFNCIFIFSTIICRSANGTLMLLINLSSIMAIKYKSLFRKLFKPSNVLITVSIMAISIPMLSSGKFDWFFDLIGRESNFSHRTFIWQSAIEMLVKKPYFGCGKDGDIYFYGRQTQAHNFYLDVAVKYGIIVLGLIIITIVLIALSLKKTKNKELLFTGSIFLFTLLMHSLFDATSMYYLCLVLFFDAKISESKNVVFIYQSSPL